MFWTNYVGLCNSVGESPNTVASKCGVKSTGTVTGWKNNSLPRPAILKNIADYFGISVEQLLADNEKPAPTNGDGHPGDEEVILDFLRSLPKERLRGILLALGAPEAVLASADWIDTQG